VARKLTLRGMAKTDDGGPARDDIAWGGHTAPLDLDLVQLGGVVLHDLSDHVGRKVLELLL
jgi:hypothetical protein